MRHIKVGIAYEGGVDGAIIAVLLKKIFEPEGYTFTNFEPETPSTAIVDFVQTYTRRFIEQNVDIGVFCTDQDDASSSRRLDIEAKIKKVDEAFRLRSIVGVAKPHLEAWLLLDEDVIKLLLKLDGSKPLPHSNLRPKDRLTALYADAEHYTNTSAELRVDIANRLDINLSCRKSTDFKRFIQDSRSVISALNL